MPRAKVDALHRRRVAHACDSCKRRKAKCDGAAPCDQCRTRRVESSCLYSKDAHPAIGAGAAEGRRGSTDKQLRKRRVPSSQGKLSAAPSPATNLVHVPVSDSSPKSPESQMLKDSRGKFRTWQSVPSSPLVCPCLRSSLQSMSGSLPRSRSLRR